MRAPIAAALALAAAAPGAGGCSGQASGKTAAGHPEAPALTRPTKDEVLRVGGRPLTLTGYYALRQELRHASTEATLWVGSAALALRADALARGREVSMRSAVQIARYAIAEASASGAQAALREFGVAGDPPPPPAQLKNRIEGIMAQHVIIRNPQVLASLNQP